MVPSNITFKDHFSGHAKQYADARPHYPVQMFHHLAELAPARSHAWDCGTGSGQAALSLAECFDAVLASDPSMQQIRHAGLHPRIYYHVATAENSCLADRRIDLVMAAQALHWFDVDSFYTEVQRVLKRNGVLAVSCYQLFRIDPEIDHHIDAFYKTTIGPYWPAERKYVDTGYSTLPFPFEELEVPEFSIQHHWDLTEVAAYIRSWSATGRYINEHGKDPVTPLLDRLSTVWGHASRHRLVVWPLKLRVGRMIA